MPKESKNLLYISKKTVIIFLSIISLIWIVPAVNLIVHYQFFSAIKLLLFGFLYMVVLYGLQTYFKKMLILYQRNLDKASAKAKKKKY